MPRLQKIVTPVVVMFLILACGMKNTERSRVVEEATVYSALINEQLEIPFSYLMGDPIIIVNSTVYDLKFSTRGGIRSRVEYWFGGLGRDQRPH